MGRGAGWKRDGIERGMDAHPSWRGHGGSWKRRGSSRNEPEPWIWRFWLLFDVRVGLGRGGVSWALLELV